MINNNVLARVSQCKWLGFGKENEESDMFLSSLQYFQNLGTCIDPQFYVKK